MADQQTRPNRLIIPRPHFDTQYQQYFLYFFDKSAQVLVPEPVYVPRGLQAPTLLVAGAAQGPGAGAGRASRARSCPTRHPAGRHLGAGLARRHRRGAAQRRGARRSTTTSSTCCSPSSPGRSARSPGVERMRVTVDGTPVDLPGCARRRRGEPVLRVRPGAGVGLDALFGIRDGRVVTLSSDRREPDQRSLRHAGAGAALDRASTCPRSTSPGSAADGTRVVESDKDRSAGQAGHRRPTYARSTRGGTDLLRPGLRPLRPAVGGRPDPRRRPAVRGARRRRDARSTHRG